MANTSYLDTKIKELKKEINYEKRKMRVCAYGKSDIYYLSSLENKLEQLEQQRNEI